MKKTTTIMTIFALLTIALLVVACGPQAGKRAGDVDEKSEEPAEDARPAPKPAKVVDEAEDLPVDEGPSIDKSYDTRRGDYTTPVDEAPVEEPGKPSADPSEKPKDLPVSQEELDALKADIEGISADDLGGLEE